MTLPDDLIQIGVLGTIHSEDASPANHLWIDVARAHLTTIPTVRRTQQAVPIQIMPRPPYLTDEALRFLGIMGRGCYRLAVMEWSHHVQARGLFVPPHYLPNVLNLGYRAQYMRYALFPLIGSHGIWLANIADFNNWQWVNTVEPPPENIPSEKVLIRQLRGRNTGLFNEHPAMTSLIEYRRVWSEELGDAVIYSLRMHLHSRTRREDNSLRARVEEIATFMPLSQRKQFLAVLGGRLNNYRKHWNNALYEAQVVFDFRLRMLEAIERRR